MECANGESIYGTCLCREEGIFKSCESVGHAKNLFLEEEVSLFFSPRAYNMFTNRKASLHLDWGSIRKVLLLFGKMFNSKLF